MVRFETKVFSSSGLDTTILMVSPIAMVFFGIFVSIFVLSIFLSRGGGFKALLC